MVTVYHNLVPDIPARLTDSAFRDRYQPEPCSLELAGVVADTDDLDGAFDRTIHRDGENWTDYGGVVFFGDRRGRRSSQEGDVFVESNGRAFLVLARGFRALPGLRLPFLPWRRYDAPNHGLPSRPTRRTAIPRERHTP